MAILRLMSLGLEAKLHHDPNLRSGMRTGAVLQQSPRPGDTVARGTQVMLTVP
jgi:beta-lactam-binding protein with PASTA domain